jgi:phage terminase Nu1 subunit (DNA packaging protein)
MDGRIAYVPGTRRFDASTAVDAYYRRMDPAHAHHAHLADLPASADADPAGIVTLAEARRRREVAKAEQAELDLARAKGELVAAEDVRRVWYEALRVVRDRVLAVPALVGAEVAAETSSTQVREILTRALTEALSTAADGLSAGGEG